MARLRSVSEQFRIARQGTLEETRQVVIRTAKKEHARIMSTAPRPSSFVRRVDGREGAPEEAVKPNGIVLYNYPRIGVVVEFALETLKDRSPRLSGLYRDSHMLFVNGVPADAAVLADWKEGDEVLISNVLPYSRKIEVGHMRMRVPGTDQVYQQAAQIVRASFGNLVAIQFKMLTAQTGGYVLKGVFSKGYKPHARKRLQRDTSAGAQQTYPALIFTAR